MSILSPTNLETTEYGQQGWNAILKANVQRLNTLFNRLWAFLDKGIASDGESDPDKLVVSTDSRLSDARTPVSHTHPWNQIIDAPDFGDATSIGGDEIDASGKADGRVLGYDAGSGKVIYRELPSGSDAGSILGVLVNDAAKADGKVLKYNAATNKLEYAEDVGAGTSVTSAQAKKYAIIFG
jgi:hypothetical protein